MINQLSYQNGPENYVSFATKKITWPELRDGLRLVSC